ncbi:MAG: porin family protein [Tabrizicola sp.]|nr:porin family protein [Tabrizicola sp.]
MRFAVSALSVLMVSPVSAQDWSGQWGGLSLGYGAGSYEQGDVEKGQAGVEVDVDSLLLGLQYQRSFQQGSQVWGFDIGLSNGVKGAVPQGPVPVYWSCDLGDCNVKIEALLTVRGRYGWLWTPETMIYGVGGLAAGKVEGGIQNSFQQGSSTATGYTIGVGLAHMVRPDLVLYGEINHIDLGTLEFGWGDGPEDTLDGSGDFDTVVIGASFRF